jgi:hypothetical protein
MNIDPAAPAGPSLSSGKTPRVSVGIPVFNGEKFIREAIDSVLCQEGMDFELVITDNRSTDGTQAICEEYARRDQRVRYQRNDQNLGLVGNFRRSAELARGTYFTWLAHDDSFGTPRYLAELAAFLDTHPDVVLCGSSVSIFDAENPGQPTTCVLEAVLPEKEWKSTRLDFFRWPQPPFHGLVIYGLFRREPLMRVTFASRMHRGKQVAMDMEYPILAGLCRHGRIVALPQVLKRSRSVSDSAACQQMESFSAWDYFCLALGMKLRILKIALSMPLPLGEKLEVLKVALANFGRAHFGQRPRFMEVLKGLRQEVATLSKACEERLQLLHKASRDMEKQNDLIDALRKELAEAKADSAAAVKS